jgi:hypothetical protein
MPLALALALAPRAPAQSSPALTPGRRHRHRVWMQPHSWVGTPGGGPSLRLWRAVGRLVTAVFALHAAQLCGLLPVPVCLRLFQGGAAQSTQAGSGTPVPSVTAPLLTADRSLGSSISSSFVVRVGVDLDGNGGPADLLVHDAGRESLLLFSSDGGLPWPTHTSTTLLVAPGLNSVSNILAWDWDGPGVGSGGCTDLLIATTVAPGLRLLVGDGPAARTFSSPALTVTMGSVQAAVLVDVDGDGYSGEVLVCENSTQIVWYRGDGGAPPTFQRYPVASLASGSCRALYAGDLTGDGLVDVALCSSASPLLLYLNIGSPGAPLWGSPQTLGVTCQSLSGGDGACLRRHRPVTATVLSEAA